MNRLLNKLMLLLLCLSPLLFDACQQPKGDNPGSEYMPDMAHSVAYEANHYTYYYFNTWGSAEEYYKMAQPRKPVNGTIPRGYAGYHYATGANAQMAAMKELNGGNSTMAISVPVNGSVPYHYVDTEEDRVRASNEILRNPFPITEKGLAIGKELYAINCAICHGDKGDGAGLIYENGAYPAAPADFLQDTFYNSSNGRFYHALIYGKNVMGGYADKLSYEERWQVIHWIHALQAKEKKLVYNADVNTLNNIDMPMSNMPKITEELPEAPAEEGHPVDEERGGDGHEHDDGGHHGGQGH